MLLPLLMKVAEEPRMMGVLTEAEPSAVVLIPVVLLAPVSRVMLVPPLTVSKGLLPELVRSMLSQDTVPNTLSVETALGETNRVSDVVVVSVITPAKLPFEEVDQKESVPQVPVAGPNAGDVVTPLGSQ